MRISFLLALSAVLATVAASQNPTAFSSPASSQSAQRSSDENDEAPNKPFPNFSHEEYKEARAMIETAHSLRCQFPRGSVVDPADRDLRRRESAGGEGTFDAIDRQRGRARVIGKTGAGDVAVISGSTALTFVEVAPTGNPHVTTVFPRFRAGSRELLAADSEHAYALGDIMIGQYYGSCAVLE